MNNSISFKRPVLIYFILTYVLFWVLVALTVVAMQLNAPKIIQDILPYIDSYAPTLMLLILFKRLYPLKTIKSFLKEQFGTHIKASSLIVPLVVQVLIMAAFTIGYSLIKHVPFSSFVISSPGMIFLPLVLNLLSGPIGEELGWRGFAFNTLQKKHSPLWSAIILGLVWGFWHIPVWFTYGFSVMVLLEFILYFMLAIVATTIIMAYFYNLSKNIIIAMVIHLLFNYLKNLVNLDFMIVFPYYCLGYVMFALILIIINPKKILYGKKPEQLIRV